MNYAKTGIETQQSRHSQFVLVNAPLFVLLIAALFSYPDYPSFALDPSWKMAFGQFFPDGRQFGPEVTCTFGPLGFLYANTYIGLPFWGSILWQLCTAAVFALVIIDSAQLLTGIRRIIYFAFFLFLGSFHTGTLHQMIIAVIGFELIHRSGEDWRLTTALLVLFLALLASIKFTNLILASFAVLIVCVHQMFRCPCIRVLRLALCFLAGFLVLWIACGQSPYNLPMYLHNSWYISQGYHTGDGASYAWPTVLAGRHGAGYALSIRIAVSHTAF